MSLVACSPTCVSVGAVRTRSGRSRLVRALVAGVWASGALGGSLAAQGVVGGTVIDSTTRLPIDGAQITVENTTLGALADATGHFRIRGVRGNEVRLVARRIGYAAQTKVVAVGDTTVQIVLAPRATSLDVVIVTGTPMAATKREIGNAVTAIDAATVARLAPVQSFQELVNGRAPNVVIMPGSGQVGSGAKIRVRGTSSLGLAQTPLIYVDGVRTDNAQATGPANQAFGSSSISRWNDIDPEDIDRIEIIKGPSAATLYGTEASNGVVQILTKEGAAGRSEYTFTMRQGINFIMDPEGRWPINYNLVNGQVETVSFSQIQRLYEQRYGEPIFHNGHYQKYHASASGGSDRLHYYVSGVREEDDGVEPSNDLGRTGARVNLGFQPSDQFRISTHVSYLTGRTNLAPEAGYGGRVWTTILMDPASLGDSSQLGFYSGLPWQYDETYHMYQDLDRFTGSLEIMHQPTRWFSHRLIFGADQTNTMDVEMASRIDSLLGTSIGSDALGYKSQTSNSVGYRTFDYAATAGFDLRPSLRSTTSVGGQYYRSMSEYVTAYGSVFPAPGLTSVSATTVGRGNDQDAVENATLGFYVQEQLGWAGRRYLTLALRSDKNSAFGVGYGRAYYPKASISWVVSDEPFWRWQFIN